MSTASNRILEGLAKSRFQQGLQIGSNYDLALAKNKPEFPQHRGARLAPARGVQIVFKGKRNVGLAKKKEPVN